MKESLQSKTILGLMIILTIACAMAVIGKLTAELVDVLKYVGSGFMAVRVMANHPGNKDVR